MRAARRRRERAAERPGDEERRRPSPKGGEPARRKRAERQRLGGFVIVERAARDLRIEVGRDDVKAHERTGRIHGLDLLAETPVAIDRLAHVFAAVAGQRVVVALEPAQSLNARQVLAPRLGVELGHDPVELFERPAQSLAVLLGELRTLRADESGQHGDRQGKSARKHRRVRLRRDNGS